MKSHRATAVELARLLNSAPRPIYVLDDAWTIVFLNRACREWLGSGAEGLLGRRCAYHSDPAAGGAEALAAGLCPPPQVAAGECTRAIVARPAEGGGWIERAARFFPLGLGGEDVLGILALVESEDRPAGADGASPLPVQPAEPPGDESQSLHDLLRRFRQEAALRHRIDRLIGRGPEMQLARRQVELAAGVRSSVFLAGPPGSGRRHLAAAIHYAGLETGEREKEGDRFFIPLDCALLGAELPAEAHARLETLGRPAASCTVLLHRVDALPLEVQAELAERLLRRALPTGRWIATGDAPPAELVRQGKLRGDLAAALGTIVVVLPPLAARRDDLPLLAQAFLESCNLGGLRQIGGFTPAALDRLDAYAWPGNLDELAEVVAEAHRRAAGPMIDVGDLPERLHWAARAAARPHRPEETIVLDEFLARVERELIRRALARAKGNKARAARLLGLTRPRLYRRMEQLGLEDQGRGERHGERGT